MQEFFLISLIDKCNIDCVFLCMIMGVCVYENVNRLQI